MTRAPEPDLDGHPVLDAVHLARQTFEDPELQRDLLTLFDAQCDRILAELGGTSRAEVAFAAHAVKGAANAIGAARVAALADRLEALLADGTDSPEAAGLVARLRVSIVEARGAIAGRLRET